MDSNFLLGFNSNLKIHEKWSRIHVAVWHGFYSIVESMIIHGTPADSSYTGRTEFGFTPLHLAALKNQVKCAEVLLQYGASISPKTGAICDPIHIAVFKNHKEMTSLLLDHGADVNLRFNNNFFKLFYHELPVELWEDHNLPLLHCSILLKFKEMTELLLTRHADLDLKTSLEKTVLMQAIEVNDVELVKNFLSKGVNVNDRDSSGQPVLHFMIYNARRKRDIYSIEEHALKKEKLEILKYLVDAGADINAQYPASISKSAVIHYMIIYRFSLGVMYLLNNSELNWQDIDIQTISSEERLHRPEPSNDYPVLHMRELDQEFAYIMFLIVQWAVNRRLLGLPVDEKILLEQPTHNWIYRAAYSKKISAYCDQTKKIVDFVKKNKIKGTRITLYQLLTCKMKDLVKLVSVKSVRCLEGVSNTVEIKLNHPLMFMLVRRLNFANKKRLIVRNSTEIISNIFIEVLPYDCCRYIVQNLDYQDLRKIVCY